MKEYLRKEPFICPECGREMQVDHYVNYREDADGNRGVKCPVWECPECGYEVVDLP